MLPRMQSEVQFPLDIEVQFPLDIDVSVPDLNTGRVAHHVNRISGAVLLVVSLIGLLTVLIGLAQPPQPTPADEGTLAHIFKLSIAALVPITFVFLATADWSKLWRSARPLAIAAAVTILAFAALYYLEHR
jgi:uncharacterized membrane protein